MRKWALIRQGYKLDPSFSTVSIVSKSVSHPRNKRLLNVSGMPKCKEGRVRKPCLQFLLHSSYCSRRGFCQVGERGCIASPEETSTGSGSAKGIFLSVTTSPTLCCLVGSRRGYGRGKRGSFSEAGLNRQSRDLD